MKKINYELMTEALLLYIKLKTGRNPQYRSIKKLMNEIKKEK